MYRLAAGIKEDPVRRWALPDRIFFGHGACHILAGVYLSRPPLPGFHAERVTPTDDRPGNHVYVTDGTVAFDHRGYSLRDRLLAHHWRGHLSVDPNWDARIERVDFDLLSTAALNARRMRGPDQYLQDPRPRAAAFLARRDHARAAARARQPLAGPGASA